MATTFQIICIVLIIAAAAWYIFRNKDNRANASTPQLVLAVFQIVLCGWFFSLCVSDVLDIQVSFSYERLIVNIFYALAFLALAIYTLFFQQNKESVYFKSVICAYILLIAVQCFVFPYGTEDILIRIFETLEGAVVFGLLVASLFKLEDTSFTGASFLAATVLELIIAVGNTVMPFSSITDDIQAVDIPLNYAALFMRPVLFASLTLSYRAWLNRRNVFEWISPENHFSKLFQVFIRPFSAGAELVEKKDIKPSMLAAALHVLSSGMFFYLLSIKTDGLLQRLVEWINNGTNNMLWQLTETVKNFLRDLIVSLVGTAQIAGEPLQEPMQVLAEEGVDSLADEARIWVDTFFTDLSKSLRLPSLTAFGISILIVAAVVVLLAILTWAVLKIAKHKWHGFKNAFCLSAVRSTVTIPFAIVSALLACVNPLLGILLFSFAIFWSMGHMYTAVMAAADKTSGNRSAAWFPPVLILMYLLTAAVLIALIVFAGAVLYYQLEDMVEIYISYITAATAS